MPRDPPTRGLPCLRGSFLVVDFSIARISMTAWISLPSWYRNRNYRNSLFPDLGEHRGGGKWQNFRTSEGTHAIFSQKVVELRSFAAAAGSRCPGHGLEAVSRLEERLGARLFNRTSRRLARADRCGPEVSERAARLLADGKTAENEATGAIRHAARGLVRLAVPMTFGVRLSRPLLPEFAEQYPESIDRSSTSDTHGRSDRRGLTWACASRDCPDSSLIARQLCAMPRYTVASPSYLKRWGRPARDLHLAEPHPLVMHVEQQALWHYTNASGEQASVRPAGTIARQQWRLVLPSVMRASASPICPTSSSTTPSHRGSRGDPEGWKQPRERRASGDAARRPLRPRRGARGFSGEAFCQGKRGK